MRKVINLILTLLLFANNSISQSIDSDVKASAGASFKDQNVFVDWTLGEPFTEYVSDANNSISNGFQQAFDIIENCAGYCLSISGNVHAGDENLQSGTVFIINKTGNAIIDSFEVINGYFKFEQIQPGEYLLYAKPTGSYGVENYMPTFYPHDIAANDAFVFKLDTFNIYDIIEIGSVNIYLAKIITSIYPLENKQFSILIYPNPAKDDLFVKDLHNFDASIFDLSGRKMLQFAKANNSIDISYLKAGTYLIHLRFKEKTFIQKFIKQ